MREFDEMKKNLRANMRKSTYITVLYVPYAYTLKHQSFLLVCLWFFFAICCSIVSLNRLFFFNVFFFLPLRTEQMKNKWRNVVSHEPSKLSMVCGMSGLNWRLNHIYFAFNESIFLYVFLVCVPSDFLFTYTGRWFVRSVNRQQRSTSNAVQNEISISITICLHSSHFWTTCYGGSSAIPILSYVLVHTAEMN